MYRPREMLIIAGDERHLGFREIPYLEIFQHPRHFHLYSIVYINGTPHGIVSPMHHIRKCFIYDYFIFRTRHTARLERHTHHCRIVLPHIVTGTCGKKHIARCVTNHRAAISADRRIVGTGHRLYIRKPFKEPESGITLFILVPIGIGKRHPLRIIPHILVQHILILHHHHAHQSANECHPCKLDEKQRTLPAFLPFGIAAEHLGYGNTGKQTSRQYSAHQKQYADHRQRNPDTFRSKQQRKFRRSGIFKELPEIQQHQSHQEQRRRNDNARFQKEHAEYLAAACPVAFMHAYRFGTVCK